MELKRRRPRRPRGEAAPVFDERSPAAFAALLLSPKSARAGDVNMKFAAVVVPPGDRARAPPSAGIAAAARAFFPMNERIVRAIPTRRFYFE